MSFKWKPVLEALDGRVVPAVVALGNVCVPNVGVYPPEDGTDPPPETVPPPPPGDGEIVIILPPTLPWSP